MKRKWKGHNRKVESRHYWGFKCRLNWKWEKDTACFTNLDQGSKIKSRFSLSKSMKHTVEKKLKRERERKRNTCTSQN